MPRPPTALFTACLALAVASAFAGPLDTIGFTDLLSRYGTNLHTGAGVAVAQVEADEDGTNSPALLYHPATNDPAFSGIVFSMESPSAATSTHATIVGGNFYGDAGVARGVADVRCYEANDFLTEGLGSDNDPPPGAFGVRVMNHSWIGSYLNESLNTNALRRLDHVIDTQGISMAAGINNINGQFDAALLGQAYNAVTVGLSPSAGTSASGPTWIDEPGRAKPDLVVPESLTSWGTPLVAGAMAVLIDAALANTNLAAAADPRAVKALLLATAAKLSGWQKGTNGPGDDSQVPLDFRQGAGELRLNRAYDLLLAGSSATGAVASASGWSRTPAASSATNLWFFNLDPDQHRTFSAVLAWHRHVTIARTRQGLSFTYSENPSLANLSLSLFRTSSTNTLGQLVATSTSAVDNVEHIYLTNFTAGLYALAVTSASQDPTTNAIAWFTDPGPPPTVTVTAAVSAAAELGPVPGAFLISRTAPTSTTVTVQFTLSGAAAAEADYSLPTTNAVILPPGVLSTNLVLSPVPDALPEGPESATLTLAPSTNYSLGVPAQASVTIADHPIDQWKFETFSPAQIADPLVSGDNADADGDGLSTLFEFSRRSNPLTAGAAPPLAVTLDPDPDTGLPHAVLEYLRPIGGGGLAFTLEHAPHEPFWGSAESLLEPLGPPEPLGDGFTERVRHRTVDPAADPAALFRLGISRAP